MNLTHDEVKAIRYSNLISHAHSTGHSLTIHKIPATEDSPSAETNTHFMVEVACEDCEWWDHWDERKEDWITPL